MAEALLKKFEDLIAQGTQLAPLGGFEFSGYNARLQNKYLEWRKACLETLEQVGPIGFPHKSKILGDANGGYFFQASAQLILNQMKELFEKIKASPDLAAEAPVQAAAPAATPASVSNTDSGGARVLKPPPKAAAAPAPPAAKPAASSSGMAKRVYVIGEEGDPIRVQLADFLREIGLEEVALNREKGKMLALDAIEDRADVKFAFFVFNSADLAYAMFELGHFVGKLGKNHVCVLHMTDVDFPKGVPGVIIKPIVVKLEEASFSLIKELKNAGYQVSI
ncbi:MAG TPA: TIR domain-containing protein [Bacteroidota bacterium]|nr:TIR domain-containing protein [Bacteroidota bacterium]